MTGDSAYPVYSVRELRADRIVHVVGLAAALAAVVPLWMAGAAQDIRTFAALAVYGAGLLSMIGFSAWYHLDIRPARRGLLRRLDHAAIFAMIAGTYTPFAALVLPGRRGLILLAVVWSVALAGMALKLAAPRRFERLSVIVYLALGWAVISVAAPFVAVVPPISLLLLAAGGTLYTLGVGVHLCRRLPYQNAIWHGLVLVAAGCHYAAVLDSVILA